MSPRNVQQLTEIWDYKQVNKETLLYDVDETFVKDSAKRIHPIRAVPAVIFSDVG